MFIRHLCLAFATILSIGGSLSFVAPEALIADDLPKLPTEPLQLNEVELRDSFGKPHQFSELRSEKVTVVVFLGTECPLAKQYAVRLNELNKSWSDNQVKLVAVISNEQDSLADMTKMKTAEKLEFELHKDLKAKLADLFHAERTPEAFVLDSKSMVRYRGRIDDQLEIGKSRTAAKRDHLKIAVEEVLAGKDVSVPVTEAIGCHIGRPYEQTEGGDFAVTYYGQIESILQKHCLECHREGDIGPMSFTDLDEVRGWAETIAEVVDENRMPPWHANAETTPFANQRLLTDDEKQLIFQWVESGAPIGKTPEKPASPSYVANGTWRFATAPDQVVEMSEQAYQVPATGVIDYQYFVVDPKFTEDKWVKGAQVIPGDAAVVHHCIVFIRSDEKQNLDGMGWLAAYVPGQEPMTLHPGQARRVPAGSKFVFQMHYTTNGKATSDKTKVGLWFEEDDLVSEEVLTAVAINQNFEIPPREENFQVHGQVRGLPPSAKVLSVSPHMHVRGKGFMMWLRDENTSREQLILDVPKYDFNWQHVYRFKEPLQIGDLRDARFVATFDNSENNISNPDPSATVRWGDQTFEEMAIGFLDLAIPREITEDARKSQGLNAVRNGQKPKEDPNVKADRYLERFDKNKNGLVERNEVPETFSAFAFRRYDADRDDKISREELISFFEK